MYIATVGSAFPPHYADQDTLIAAFRQVWAGRYHNVARIEQLHRNVLVGGRHLALPIADYLGLAGFTAANDAFVRVAVDMGAAAVTDALARVDLTPRDVDAIWFTSVTGIAAPSIDARLVNRLGFRPDLKRTPIFGLGCVAGAAGVARVADYLRGNPDDVAILLSVELCSLTLQKDDLSIPNLIASGLFGDGAACVVMLGERRAARLGLAGDTARPTPRVVATRSVFYPDTEDVMGWKIGSDGFRIVLSAEVPDMVRKHLRGDADAFLAANGLDHADIAAWVAHPGGPKVLEAMEAVFPLPAGALERTWRSLREVGNLSSASVLLVLQETLAAPPPPGSYGMIVAMGPGFCSELVLLRW
ncbi:MAG: type III polyketide synthase [Myxococcota bacterium]